MVLTTAGLSVDPDDVTKEGIEATGAEVLFYGTPVFPGAMFLVARLKGRYILGAPACVYYNRNTVLDIVLTRILAGERMHRADMVKLSSEAFHAVPNPLSYMLFGKGCEHRRIQQTVGGVQKKTINPLDVWPILWL